MEAELNWVEGMRFEANNRGHKMIIDAQIEHGGSNLGPSPKEIVLNAMMGCTAMDVISILKKMRTPPNKMLLHIEAQKNESHPIHFNHATITFDIQGEVPLDKATKAIESSLTKYCGVNYMISKVCDIEYVLKINGEKLHSGKAQFIDPLS